MACRAGTTLLSEHVFRTGRSFDLVSVAELPADQREALARVPEGARAEAVLLPRRGAPGTIKVIGRDLAALLAGLAEPSRLPDALRHGADAAQLREIEKLVLDGALEIEVDGVFVSGPAAAAILSEEEGNEDDGGALARLSRDALRYADALQLDDIPLLAGKLYCFNGVPVTPWWVEKLPDRAAVLDWLGGSPGANGGFESEWKLRSGRGRGWLTWSRRDGGLMPSEDAPSYKLYVSPEPERLPGVACALMKSLRDSGACLFKVGGEAADVLRPDKLVVYFASRSDLEALATRLGDELEGCPAQGVPFTAQIDDDGLLSFGMDPPRARRELFSPNAVSWRAWVTCRLAAALASARATSAIAREGGPGAPPPPNGGMPGWRFALYRLRLDGVDVDRWSPSADAPGGSP